MIKDSPTARNPATSMRDLLRQLERQKIKPPARPNPPTTLATFSALSSPETDEPAAVAVGSWVLSEDPDSGDLVATNADGVTKTLATRGDQ